MTFKYHAGNTDHRFYWHRGGLTDEDYAIMRSGCVPMIDQERHIALHGTTDAEVMARWTRNCTTIRKAGLSPTKWKIRQLLHEIMREELGDVFDRYAG